MACGAVAAAVGIAGGAATAAAATPAQCHNGKTSSVGDTIGLSFAQQQALFSQLQNDIEHFAKLTGCDWKFKVTNAGADPSQQITDAQQLIAQGANLVWVNQAQAQGWNPVVQHRPPAPGKNANDRRARSADEGGRRAGPRGP
jgi:ABC-type sugar transport system substrate-binding protein